MVRSSAGEMYVCARPLFSRRLARPTQKVAISRSVSGDSRRGKKRAAMAVAHSILVAAYEMIRRGVDYKDLGANFPRPPRCNDECRAHPRGLWKRRTVSRIFNAPNFVSSTRRTTLLYAGGPISRSEIS
jgi:hypothetical protein